VIVHFVDIGGIVYHHCLNKLYFLDVFSAKLKRSSNSYTIVCILPTHCQEYGTDGHDNVAFEKLEKGP